jgi:hypothetical protein
MPYQHGDISYVLLLGIVAWVSVASAYSAFASYERGKGVAIVIAGLAVAFGLHYFHQHLPPGYVRDKSSWWPYAKTWVPGSRRTDLPNAYASRTEQDWLAQPGYVFTDDDHPPQAYTVISSREFKATSHVRAVWRSGRSHPVCTHMVAASQAGNWLPQSGYRFVDDRFTVRRLAYTTQAPSDITGDVVGAIVWCAAAANNKEQSVWDKLWKIGQDAGCEASVRGGIHKLTSNGETVIAPEGPDIKCDYLSLNWQERPVRRGTIHIS